MYLTTSRVIVQVLTLCAKSQGLRTSDYPRPGFDQLQWAILDCWWKWHIDNFRGYRKHNSNCDQRHGAFDDNRRYSYIRWVNYTDCQQCDLQVSPTSIKLRQLGGD
jgi:hypothetical protein